jgi:hypothetical protein
MANALRALAALLTDFFHEPTVPPVIAAQAGLDTTLIQSSAIQADLWWAIVTRAAEEGRLRDLIDVAKGRVGGRGAALEKAYQAYEAERQGEQGGQDAPPASVRRRKPPPPMSDTYRSAADSRIDQLQKEFGQLQGQLAALQAQMAIVLKQQDAIVALLQRPADDAPLVSSSQLTALLVAILVAAVSIVAVIYLGGRI